MSEKSIAIVTGANGGLGKEFVKLLLKEEGISEIWAIARNKEKLNQLLNEFGDKIRTFSMDLSNRASFAEIEKELNANDAAVKYLVNNAGFAKFCSYDDIGIDESLNMIDLNIGAVVAAGLTCIPYMKKNSHIINIASQASFFPLPYQNIYSSTKAFVRNYTRALNIELKDKGISATAVCPGWMKTGLFDRGLIGAEKGTNNFSGMVTPDVVAAKALKDAKKGKDISVYGLYVKSTHLLSKLIPQKMMMKIWLSQQHF
ncbi:SDR family NAD(P)-dependent oxidoreductase [Murimonas intestini]|uniref:SDR family NAD(P)-dependent oxidoreductase n=1 Tax=Murimonas intestini TaxID=1337051 RepID=A0AB73T2A8_9FIRM|nr:SDR family NAD(P)-dependent oxidoreductase [Murimonas intestini]MCR1842595.1 SDR family NAD(P)-dependent oxidoreductase [Murimonas intestini]MCR1867358.1 SDR family NAD(P)-dependent oxidoreductase [Murimonas intestini]MCR1884545.1 SDR family NAD(P)-dependent oxidoreductase [Murimonas intestini]